MMKYVLLAAVIGMALVNARPHPVSILLRNTEADKALEAEQQIPTDPVTSTSDDSSIETSVPELIDINAAAFTSQPFREDSNAESEERWAEAAIEWIRATNYGAYSWDLEELSRNHKQDETDNYLEPRSSKKVPAFQGSYTYTDEEDRLVTVIYVADENGFHPSVIIYK